MSWHKYYKDKNKEEILIKFAFKLPTKVEMFNIDDHPIHIRQNENKVNVNYNKCVSKTLLKDIKKIFNYFEKDKNIPQKLLDKNPSRYIVGYINEVFPYVNKKILDEKYLYGDILQKTISQFDISEVFIIPQDGKYYPIAWPLPMPKISHPNIKQGKFKPIFIKDLIDAMTEYFYFNFDECIRKIITSVENYFIHYDLLKFNVANNNSKSKFEKRVNTYITEDNYSTLTEKELKIIRGNISFIYKKRNQIIHDKLRLKSKHGFFAKKAIYTTLFLYLSDYINEELKDDISLLDTNFRSVVDSILEINLDSFEKMGKSNKPGLIVNLKEDYEKLNINKVINSTRITNTEKKLLKVK
jgi:hypothetical protein